MLTPMGTQDSRPFILGLRTGRRQTKIMRLSWQVIQLEVLFDFILLVCTIAAGDG